MTLVAGVLISCLCLTSCGDDIPSPEEEQLAPQERISGNTVIVYIGAENDLSSFAQEDLDEMQAALSSIPEECQVVVYRDATQKPGIFHLTSNKSTLWYEYEQDHNSADMATMQGILGDIVHNFPSEKYSLILWSHGTGWSDMANAPQRSIIMDNEENTSKPIDGQWLNVSQLAHILESLPHLEYIFFDACFMQSAEVASYLYPFTDYIIGSPVEIPGKGAPYDVIMKALCQADIPGIINGYASGYPGTYGVLLSAVCCAEFPNFCTTTAEFIPNAFPRNGMPTVNGIQIYAPTNLSGMPTPYDMRSTMFHVLSNEDFAKWELQWQKTILYPVKANAWDSRYSGSAHCELTDPEHYGGISMHIPKESYEARGWNAQFRHSPWYALTLWEQAGW